MRSRSLRCAGAAAALWLAAALGGAQEPVTDDAADVAGARARLEQAGATIRAIYVTVDNVFDPSNPEEDKRLYRWANRVHVLTREGVVRDILLFDVGDSFVGRLLDESARALRARGFIAEATAEPVDYDAVTNSVAVAVRVRDSWSLEPEIDLDHKGGETEWALGLADDNLFGTGKRLEIAHSSEIDRDRTTVGYEDGNVFGSRVRLRALLSDASDGHGFSFGAERPFFALDTRWSLGGTVHDERRVDTIYDLGEEVDEFRHDLTSWSLQGGWSRGLVGRRARRWLVGIAAEEHTFRATPAVPAPLLLPPNRKLVYPWIGWELVEDDYREMSELNDMGRTEDISLGVSFFASVGFAERRFESDRDATLLRLSVGKGWEPGGPGRLLLLEAGGSTRREDSAYRNSQTRLAARYYRRNLERHLLSVSLSALATRHLDPENQVLLGGDNGLRGYPIRYQAGERRTILTVEQRFFTDWYPWRLFRVGYAAFADVGRIGGRDPRTTPSLGTLADVGVGLRLTSPRASGRNVVHVDLAFPLGSHPNVDDVQLVVETKRSF